MKQKNDTRDDASAIGQKQWFNCAKLKVAARFKFEYNGVTSENIYTPVQYFTELQQEMRVCVHVDLPGGSFSSKSPLDTRQLSQPRESF